MTTPDLQTILTAVLDTLIPPGDDGALPGAGALGLAEPVAAGLDGGLESIRAGLTALDDAARERGGDAFASLPLAERTAVLEAHQETDPGFLAGLVFHTYSAYYATPTVLEALGMPGRPPHPLGYSMEPSDPGLLDAVRARERVFREV